jgi:DNA repair protein RecO (recombination protein O)|tara:strand:+ start:256 stop:972 length:717 start_codon:yes stop_codon:yes gene_type:complete
MVVSTKAIVISKIKYKDSDLIVKCYTAISGVKSYIIKNALKSKKGKFRPAYFQPLSQLQIEADHKESRSLHYFKDVRLHRAYESLHTNVFKSTVLLFLSEMLAMILNEEEANLPLYEYIETTLLWFDTVENTGIFHHQFLMGLTKFLGINPDTEHHHLPYFNLQEGKFQAHNWEHCITGGNLELLKPFLGTKFDTNLSIELSSSQKQVLLDMILGYFKLHLQGFKHPKSLTVLSQVYS